MNKTIAELMNVCPKCKREIKGEPAISRRDNNTEICSNCGTAEALADFILTK